MAAQGAGGDGGNGGNAGNGGDGGVGQAGGIFMAAGSLIVVNTTVAENAVGPGMGGGAGEAGKGGASGSGGQGGRGFFGSGAYGPFGEPGHSGTSANAIEGAGGNVSGGSVFINAGTITLDYVTVARNKGGVVQHGGTVNASDALFGNNSNSGSSGGSHTLGSGGTDYRNTGAGTVVAKYSLFGVGPKGVTTDGTDLTNVEPDLAPLGNYGGPTQAIALYFGSPAINAGIAINGITTDQRGFARPASNPDIGAFQGILDFVTTTGDSGYGSLRQSILDVDDTVGTSVIQFRIGTAGSQQTISPGTALPAITSPVILDGWSQGGAGYTGVPLIVIDGSERGNGTVGFDLEPGSDGSTIRGFVINDFTNAGISIATTDNTIEGCYIGTNAAGTAIGSRQMSYGVVVTAGNNTIGGTSAGTGNVISGSTADGVEITGSGVTGILVAGNLIGTSADGETALGNRDDDIGIEDGAMGNTIGGLTTKPGTGAGNLLSGSIFGDGINVEGGGSNLVEGNLIGTDLAGTTAFSNTYDGIRLQSSSGDTIGGTAAGAGNVISGNGQFNLWLNDASDETVQGNLIGTDITGNFAVDTNTYTGIEILSSSDNLIGGTAPGRVTSSPAIARESPSTTTGQRTRRPPLATSSRATWSD